MQIVVEPRGTTMGLQPLAIVTSLMHSAKVLPYFTKYNIIVLQQNGAPLLEKVIENIQNVLAMCR